MRALLTKSVGGPETLVLEDIPDPVAATGQVVIAIRACSINFPDVLMIQDKYQYRPERPYSPGSEIAGVVESVGEGVGGWKVGDRAIAMIAHGGLAEKVAIDADRLHRLPEGRTFVEGASMVLTYGTSIHALVHRGRLQAGHRLLVLGAAGGVGLAAVELGKALGARVVAAVSSEAKAAAARAAGTDETVVYPRAPFDRAGTKALAERFKSAAGGDGFDVIFDPVGGDYAEPALRAIGWEGRYLVVGFAAGIPALPLNLPLLKSCDICGVFWGVFALREPAASQAHIDQIFRMWAEGRIAPRVTEIFPLERGGEAIAKMAARDAIGKLVVQID